MVNKVQIQNEALQLSQKPLFMKLRKFSTKFLVVVADALFICSLYFARRSVGVLSLFIALRHAGTEGH